MKRDRRITGAVLEEVGRARRSRSRGRSALSTELESGPDELLCASRRRASATPTSGGRRQPAAPGADAARPRGRGHRRGGRGRGIRGGSRRRSGRDGVPARCGDCDGCAPAASRRARRAPRRTRRDAVRRGTRLTRDGDRVHRHLGVSGFATHAVSITARWLVSATTYRRGGGRARLRRAHGGGAVVNAARRSRATTSSSSGWAASAWRRSSRRCARVRPGHRRRRGAGEARRAASSAPMRCTPPSRPAEAGAGRARGRGGGHARRSRPRRVTAPGGRTVTVGLPSPTPDGAVAAGDDGRGAHHRGQLPGRPCPRATSRATPSCGGRAASGGGAHLVVRHARRHQRGDGHPRRRAGHPQIIRF